MNWYKTIEKYSFSRYLYNLLQYLKNRLIKDDFTKEKIFVIGLNKTGTTSMKIALKDFGYKVGVQEDAELLSECVLKGKYNYFLHYVKTADAFQDMPFSARNIYKLIHKKYPNSKFILTVRESDDKWFNSLNSFMKKTLINFDIPIDSYIKTGDIKQFNYRYNKMGFKISKYVWLAGKHYIIDDEPAFDEDYCKFYYNKHIKEAKEYFKDSENFLMLNIEEKDAYKKLCDFLGKEPLYDNMPHENKT